MDYRFTMTNRLIALAVISFLLLLTLLFALGFQLGQQWGAEEAKTQHRIAQQVQQAIESRNQALLAELGTKPRTTYLADVTNPNPEIVALAPARAGEHAAHEGGHS